MGPAYLQYCSCDCGTGHELVELKDNYGNYLPCHNCTKELCSRQSACLGVDIELVQSVCFQRESLKDAAVVWFFLIIVMAMTGFAIYKRYISPRR